jgi:hypothetical protein
LSEAALKLGATTGPAAAGPVASRLDSKLFASLFQLHDPGSDPDSKLGHRLTVLEIGSALPETVDFFSQFKCRLIFVNLYSEPFVRDQVDLSETELRHAFEECFRFPAGTRLDLCLFWDFLSYLDDPALRAFNSALRPWLHAGSRAHGYGAHHLAVRLAHVQYGIHDRATLSVRERRGRQLPTHPHSQVEMQDMLNCFAFERGLLLADGRLEMLLKPRL